MGVSFDDTLAHLQEQYAQDRLDYETAPRRAVARVWQADGDLAKLVDDDTTANPDEKEEYLLRFRRTSATMIIEASPGKVKTPTLKIVRRLFGPGEIVNYWLKSQ